ncbi:FecR family protein [Xylophilus sp.]|uniref:FecR family protein n=1 Tax=Xylophilus sp. TaxID=2653893 RepID=UPI0013B81BFE|nr:FecR domain-containing protein [Xylophilus sp.]KAF1043665.1 MAG: Protein FecR [Xylophilus sp.]
MNAPNTPAPDANDDGEALLGELSPVELQALRWTVRAGDGLDAGARAALQDWLDADPAHRAAYEDMAGAWAAIDEIPPAGHARMRAGIAIDASTIYSPNSHASASVGSPLTEHTPHSLRRRRMHAAAAVAALAVLGGGWLDWSHWQNQPVFSRHYATARGQSLDVALPDGSSLVLDTATEAGVTLYRRRREVRLPEGQALFQVQPDRARPFDVLAGAARITVVGTKFSVRYTPSMGSRTVQVAVIEGRVRVVGEGDAAAVELAAGQTVAADARGRLGAVAPVAAEAIGAWRGRRLSFDGVPLAEVLAETGRYGDIGVRLRDPAAGSLPVTASVDLRNTAAFVHALPQVLPVRLERRGDGLEIVASRH